ncbi:MAG TPA: CapA family protein, partial [Candidatus Paceibacterota bacterium]|nr:CapA family protein [Candidatus Paceibacterota bacterium]
HTLAQERLAKELVDDGADLVIGHHPHVVEDVALYRGKPVFYSLGNFVFDQYFSTDVMEGLGVTLTLENEYADYALTGYATMESRSAPYVMSTTSSSALYARVLQNVPGAELERGTFSVPR